MDRIVYIAALDRVVVDVLDLLPHHRFILNQLRMRAFLPDLIFPIDFVRGLALRQLLKHLARLLILQVIDDLTRRERLEIADLFRQVR